MECANEQRPVLSGREKVKCSALDVEDGPNPDSTGNVQDGEIFNLNDNSTTEEKVNMIVVCSVPIIFTFLLSVFGTSIMMFFAGKLSKEMNDSNISSVFAFLVF